MCVRWFCCREYFAMSWVRVECGKCDKVRGWICLGGSTTTKSEDDLLSLSPLSLTKIDSVSWRIMDKIGVTASGSEELKRTKCVFKSPCLFSGRGWTCLPVRVSIHRQEDLCFQYRFPDNCLGRVHPYIFSVQGLAETTTVQGTIHLFTYPEQVPPVPSNRLVSHSTKPVASPSSRSET